jgi:hypothetical protein
MSASCEFQIARIFLDTSICVAALSKPRVPITSDANTNLSITTGLLL